MNKSIDHIKKEAWFTQKPWLIVGTGPTLVNWKQDYLNKFNIWTINAAVDFTGYADISALHDPEAYFIDLDYTKKFTARYYLTRTVNNIREKYTPTIYAQLHGDPDFGFEYHTRHNSSGFAWYFLGVVCRFSEIYCIGIDGGTEVFNQLSQHYKNHENGTDFEIHNHAMNYYQKLYGYKIIKL